MTTLVALACLLAAAPGDWQLAPGPLRTRWAAEVSPTNALPDYPRMQLRRARWQNLNGLWDYAIAPKAAEAAPAWEGQILVPYCVESQLSGVRRKVDQNQRLWYRRNFTVPGEWAGQRVLLHFGAVDWQATVSVNGKQLLDHKGGFDPFTLDLTDVLKPGANELTVAVWDPTESGHYPRGKQNRGSMDKPGGIMYTPCTGIWQTVWLEPVPKGGLDNLKLVPHVDEQYLEVTATAGADQTVTAVASDAGREVGRVSGKAGEKLKLSVPAPRLWTPDSPFLYDLKVTVGQDLDAVDSYFAMRTSDLGKDAKGVTRIRLNKQPFFLIGPLDQGYWPDGIYTAPTDAALRYDLEIYKKIAWNGLRKHTKYEPDRFYYWCDKMGLAVWQDMPSAHGRLNDAEREQFNTETKAMIDALGNHPSIVMWVNWNEGWGEPGKDEVQRMVKWTKDYDPSRLVSNASGWTDQQCGDIVDMHNYPGPGAPKLEENRAAVLGEFGGLGLHVADHMWSGAGWGYREAKDITADYCKLIRKLLALRDNAGLCAGIYTQTSDCENELNGLLTYDRAVLKVDAETVANAHRGIFGPEPVERVIIPTSETEKQTWRYTLEDPGANWTKPDFDDSKWQSGPGGFGTPNTPGAIVGTNWNKVGLIWLRRTFELKSVDFKALQLRMHHDEDADVYFNGVKAASEGHFTSEYQLFPVDKAAVAALKVGTNTLAVRCKQTMGGQFIDVGLSDAVPAK